MNLRSEGRRYEDLALAHLTQKGLALVERNYRTARGEIDLVMRDDETLVFVEVRYRTPSRFGGGLESVDVRKQRKIISAAKHFLQQSRLDRRLRCRFDIVALDGQTAEGITWIPRAFTADET